jgi:arylsulfatase A-like enzyme
VAIGAVAVAAAVVAVTLVLVEPGGSSKPRSGSAAHPTIVLILTDDQRWDSLGVMPTVRSELIARGVTFTNGFVTDPLCCPSRASILTGRYPHSTGVWSNRGPMGGFEAFHDGSTVATWLHAGGYHTGLFGKYLNKYEGTYVPPGWDRWVALSGTDPHQDFYYGYDLNVDGTMNHLGHDTADYSTDVLAAHTISFIRETQGPLFVEFAPFAPHAPGTPAPEDAGRTLAGVPSGRPPSFLEPDLSDKPEWLRSHQQLNASSVAANDVLRRDTFASLLAVDRAVGGIVSALRETGRLADSMIVFTSDNGILWGEHGWVGKIVPYEESIRVPFVVRDDRLVSAARQDPRPVLNVDLAPTFAEAAGVAAPGAEGRSLLPLLRGDAPGWRSDFLIESERYSHVPSYCAVRDERHLYVVYDTGEEELYDLSRDPFELQNAAADPALAAIRSRLRTRLRELCSHPPPGLTSLP